MKMIENVPGHYQAEDGRTMQREHGLTPNGNALNGRWVLRDSKGMWIDFGTYRNDLAEAHGLTIKHQELDLILKAVA